MVQTKRKREAEAPEAEAEDGPDAAEDAEDDGEESIEESEEEFDEEEDEDEGGDGEGGKGLKTGQRIWVPGVDKLEEGEQLEVDMSTYDMLHRVQTEWPCLSLDILADDLGAQRSSFPHTAYVAAGTQAEKVEDQRILVMKWSNLRRTTNDDASDDSEDDSDSDDDNEPVLEMRKVPHPGSVNRIRAAPQVRHIVATWADTGKVHMWNLQAPIKSLEKAGDRWDGKPKPIFTCEKHKSEGFAMDFSPHQVGRFLSGDCEKNIFLWEPVQGGWSVGDTGFQGHTASVEDIQWKRKGESCQNVFASVSVDRSFRVWDVREGDRNRSAVHAQKVHEGDVNVLSWSPCVGELLATGGDDGVFKVWDTRSVAAGPMANFSWHRKPITSIDWHPFDETSLVVASEDGCVSLWDMAMEDDAVGAELPPGAEHFPAQLMFLHQGQQDPKEARWHRQIPGAVVSTAATGFNIFKACNQ